MDSLTLPDTNQVYLIVGGQAAAARLLDMAAHLALRGPLLLLDCGNRANPLPLVRALRRLTQDPVQALNRIHMARAFTCYQVVTLLEQTGFAPCPQPVLLFDLLASFYDESVLYAEGCRLLEQCLRCLQHLSRAAPVVISSRPPPADFPERQSFLQRLCRAADQCWMEQAPPPQVQQLSLFS